MIDHDYIEARVREATRMRDEAIGEMFRSAWHGLHELTNTLTARITHAVSAQLRAHHLLHH